MADEEKLEVPREPIDRLVGPLAKFLHVEAASGVVLLVCAVVALILANSPVQEWFLERCKELVDAMGPLKTWQREVRPTRGHAHLLGTCRMGNDPAASVVDKYHRAHDVPNLFICDGSSFVSSGRGQPTMTIQALAFRAAEHIIAFAKRGEI